MSAAIMQRVDDRIAECMEEVRVLGRLECGRAAEVEAARLAAGREWAEAWQWAETVALLLGIASSTEARAFEAREVSAPRKRTQEKRCFAHYSFLMHETMRAARRWEVRL